MRLVMLLTLALLIQPVPRPVRIILVVPPGEMLTEAERADYRTYTQASFDWWQQHAPEPIVHTLDTTEVITPNADVYHDLRWSMPYLIENNPGVTLFLIDNSESGRLLFNDSGGEAQPYYGAIWAVMNGVPSVEAIITHEIGHVVYRLEHPKTCGAVLDIMCYLGLVTAYRLGFIGCASLAALNAPCTYTYLPMVQR